MSLPMSLAYALQRINSYSTNYYRLETVNQSESAQNGVITLNMPVNSLVNLKSLALHMNARANENAITFTNDANQADTLDVSLPRIDQLITRMEIYAGGQQLVSGCQQYNTVSSVMKNMYTELQRETSYDRVLINSEINTTTGYYRTVKPYILNNFLSIIGESEPSYLDTSLVPSIQIKLYLAGPEVLGATQTSLGVGEPIDAKASAALVQQGQFKLEDLHFTVETITFADNLYDSALENRIKSQGFLEIPFYNYYTFFQSNNGGMNQSTRFSLSSQCINKLIAVQRPQTYREQPQGLVKIDNRMGSTYQPSYFNFLAGRIESWQMNVNNLFVPNYRVSALGAFNLLTVGKADNYDSSAGCKVNSLSNWYNNFWMAMVRLNMPDEMGVRRLTGLDSRGLSSQLYYSTTSGGDPNQTQLLDSEVMIIACTTSTLKVGAGRMITIDI